MKKIINGKRYDTDTAKELGSWSYSHYGDFAYVCETLYRKRGGELFLHGEGGPQTRYAQRLEENSWSGGETIIPLTYEEAKKWAEQQLSADEYEAIFGEVSETGDDDKITTTLSLAPETRELLIRMAGEAGTSMSAVVEALIRERASDK